MKVEVTSLNNERGNLLQYVNNMSYQKIEENIAETESQERYNFKSQQQILQTQKKGIQTSSINGIISSITENSKSQLYSQKEASVHNLYMTPPQEEIYMMKNYLSNFYSPKTSKEFLDKYQSQYKLILNSRNSHKKEQQMNLYFLKSISLSSFKLQNLSEIIEFIYKYKFKKLIVMQNEKISNLKQQINCNYQNFQQQPQIIQSDVTFKLKQLQQWTADFINIPDIASVKLHQQIQIQFFLFITSNYKVLKQASQHEFGENVITKKQLRQMKQNAKEDYQRQIYIKYQAISNFVDEFKKLKQNLEMQSEKGEKNLSQEENQFQQILQEQIEEEEEFEIEDFESDSMKNSFQWKICNEQQNNQRQQKNLNEISYQQLFKQKSDQYYSMLNSKSKDQLIKSNQLDSQDSPKGMKIEDEEYQQQYQEDQAEMVNEKINNKTSKTKKKKRTNNFYNLPRYFMMLIIELLSVNNLREIGLQDGFIQIISRISSNLRQQGKKNDSAKSNFYNHQHYNCLFQILLDEKTILQQQSKQTEELFRKVFGVNNTSSQFSQTYINSFKLIISQIVKYQLRIMQELELTKYIQSNSQHYKFEKSKISYISRVIAGIDKLNSGQNIYRF